MSEIVNNRIYIYIYIYVQLTFLFFFVQNYEFRQSHEELRWVDNYQAPVFSEDKTEFYAILPDPSNTKTFYRHLAAIKVSQAHNHSVLLLEYWQVSNDGAIPNLCSLISYH